MKKILTLVLASLFLTACTTGAVQNERAAQQVEPDTINTSEKSDMYTEAPPELSAAELAGKKALIKTNRGDVEFEFFSDVAPKTVSNFIFLSQESFYNNLIFHRREEGFVVQGGDPLGSGSGGPGYTVEAEINDNHHVRGAVAMARLPDQANPEKRSSGSQFYIVLDDALFLDGEYTVFGQVTKGMDVVDQIQIGDKILSIEII